MTATDDSTVPDYSNRLRLDGRGIIVFGAGNGMGRQTAHALAQVGASVACVDVDADRAQAVAEEVGGYAGVADVTLRDDVERVVQESIANLGRLDGVVDIVGIGGFAPIIELDEEQFDFDMRINLRQAYLVSQVTGRHFVANGGGTMLFISSASGMTAAPRHASYGAAKAGLISWLRTLAEELGPHGVRANGVAPGLIMTPRNDVRLTTEAKAALEANAPLGRCGTPDDIANATLFLMSDLSSYITGQVLLVDGGVGIKLPYPLGL